jgi:ElaB/YqjD/DUF883 family membrane-anchored ribosome-binding protein
VAISRSFVSADQKLRGCSEQHPSIHDLAAAVRSSSGMNPGDRLSDGIAIEMARAAATGEPSHRHDSCSVTTREETVTHMQNGNAQEVDHVFKDQLESLKKQVSKLIDRVSSVTTAAEPRLKSFTSKAAEAIRAHPIIAIAAAFGAGYLLMRMVRR